MIRGCDDVRHGAACLLYSVGALLFVATLSLEGNETAWLNAGLFCACRPAA